MKLRKLIAPLVLVTACSGAMLTVLPTASLNPASAIKPAAVSAYLTECVWTGVDVHKGHEICWNHVNNGGLNQMRVVYQCIAPGGNGGWWWTSQWVNQNTYAWADCTNKSLSGRPTPNLDYASVYYQLR